MVSEHFGLPIYSETLISIFVLIPIISRKLLLALCCLALTCESYAACEHGDINSLISRSDGICVGEVLSISSFRRAEDSAIVSEYVIAVQDAIRGKFPNRLSIIQQGGEVDGVATWPHHLSADLLPGKPYVLFLLERENGSIEILDGPEGALLKDECDHGFLNKLKSNPQQANGKPEEDLTAYAAEDLIIEQAVTANGLSTTPRRFQAQDRGEKIPVIVDHSTLPSGITTNQAMTAVQNALDAWEAATSARFYIEGTETFPSSANTIDTSDGRIRLQLHDNFNVISDASDTLGTGGGYFSTSAGSGGNLNGVDFLRSSNGYVIINHPKASLSDSVTLEAVICHEIGHVLGLAHSSENLSEGNTTLAEAIMYYRAHTDGRGASLNSWDIDKGTIGYPTDNTPPAGYIRYITAVTIPGGWTLTNPEVNQVDAYDLDGDSMSLNIASQEFLSGSFSIAGSSILYTPSGYYADYQNPNPENSFNDRALIEVSDGQYTGVIEVRVIGFASDSRPSSTPDGLPDSWMTANFGSISPTPGTSGTNDNPDGDNSNNLEEYQNGTNPNDPNSALKVTHYSIADSISSINWACTQYELYMVEESPNLVDWTVNRYVLVNENLTEATTMIEQGAGTKHFYRVSRVR